jgi:hypothetical protein
LAAGEDRKWEARDDDAIGQAGLAMPSDHQNNRTSSSFLLISFSPML